MRIKTTVAVCFGLAACATDPTSTDEQGSSVVDGSGDTESQEDDEEEEVYDCSEASVLCVDLFVPEDYAGSPRNLFVGLYDSLPPLGPPTIFLMDEDAPDFVPGESIELALRDDVPDTGEYFIFSVLYDENGGEWMPEPGIDYVATSEEAYAFDGQGLDVGEVSFELYEKE